MAENTPNVALFVTCLVDLFRPTVGFAAVKLLEDAGCKVTVPRAQTCCGQPAFNSGDRKSALGIAKSVIKNFEAFDYVVAPSGSCGGMIAKHYPELFAGDKKWGPRAEALAAKTHELTSFLVDVMQRKAVVTRLDASCTYHDSCAGLRELGVKEQPRALLHSVFGLELRELEQTEVCCGFGGTFCVKYPDISNEMVSRKAENAAETGAEMLLAGDMGCLMNIAGKLLRDGSEIEVRHVAEVLAGMLDTPAIGRANEAAGIPVEVEKAPVDPGAAPAPARESVQGA